MEQLSDGGYWLSSRAHEISSSTPSEHSDVFFDLPEMEERMEMPGRVQDPVRIRRGKSPSYMKSRPESAYVLSPQNLDAAAAAGGSGTPRGASRDIRNGSDSFSSKENVARVDELLLRESVAINAIRSSGSSSSGSFFPLHALSPTAIETQRSSTIKSVLNPSKNSSMLHRVREEEALLPGYRGDVIATTSPRLRDGKPRNCLLNGTSNRDPGSYRDEYNSASSCSTVLEQTVNNGSSSDSRILNTAWVRLETDSSLTAEQQEQQRRQEVTPNWHSGRKTGDELLTPRQATPAFATAPIDGWICVERPPMTWEDALKIAQRARETGAPVAAVAKGGAGAGAGAGAGTRVPHPLPPRISPSLLTGAGLPSTSFHDSAQASSSSSQVLRKCNKSLPNYHHRRPGHSDSVFAPLPLSPKHIQRETIIPCGEGVKARITALESTLYQDSDASAPKLESEKPQQAESSVEVTMEEIDIQDRCSAKGRLRKQEEGVGSKQQIHSVLMQEDWRQIDHDQGACHPGKNSVVGKDGHYWNAVIPHCRNSYRIEAPASEERPELEVKRNSILKEESRVTRTTNVWKLPVLEDVNVEAMQNQMRGDSQTQEEFVSAVRFRTSAPHEEEQQEEDGQDSHGLDEVSGTQVLVLDKNAPMNQFLEVTEEKKVVEEGPVCAQDNTVKWEALATPLNRSFAHGGSADQRTQDSVNQVIRRSKSSHPGSSAVPAPKSDGGKATLYHAESIQDWKASKNPLSATQKDALLSASLNEEGLQQIDTLGGRTTSNAVDDNLAAEPRQIDQVFEVHLSKLLGYSQRQAASPHSNSQVQTDERTLGEAGVSKHHDSKSLTPVGGAVMQLLGGVAVLAGLFALWPRKFGPVERYHIVQAGETLSSIAPGQCNDRTSKFCIINPRICDQKIIYPGQRLRLS